MKKIGFLLLLILCSPILKAQQTENVFVITLDGLRWQELFGGADSLLVNDPDYVDKPEELTKRFWRQDPLERREILMPFFWNELAKNGQLYGNRQYGNKVNCSNTKWFSYPGYHEILCGFADDEHVNSNNKINNPNQTVLEYLNNQKAYSGKVAAFGSWDVFPFIINKERSGIPVNAGFDTAKGKNLTEREKLLNELQSEIRGPWSGVRLDPFTHHYALEYIKKNKPKVVLIAYGETDDFAHDGEYDQYLYAAYQTDQYIKALWDYVQSDKQYKDKTTFVITTDHGRGSYPKEQWKHHGHEQKGSDQIWFAVIGPDTPALGEVKEESQYYQKQIAKTVAAFLGENYTNEKFETGTVVRDMISNQASK
ncbi:sulfatase-like hydrolase/transferase [Limibacter armeniacum]|uniref:sulfatase-like hydrolase/transferase n=1 Tax=Limibacter armeniacum TaxID=466084 RepID=UPI002FE58DAE